MRETVEFRLQMGELLPVLLLGLTFAGKKTHPDLFDQKQLLPWQSIICQHFRKCQCSASPATTGYHDMFILLCAGKVVRLAGENRKIYATNHQMSPTCHYCSQLKIMPPVPLQFSARLTRVKRITKNWSQSANLFALNTTTPSRSPLVSE